ncbi:GH1 family beta-glucosidase [Neptunicella marina]|uniref:Beta-glucosidase n=1 Tax=Neptunicella marina TaxID=2125989 RepID=A0A8J6IUX6_9ALTE|nr:GH1 family beta-glucosidase [Neptunicella marina]MBC3767161.1 beta-glucosidase [Neptunicella marina]
MKISLPTNSNMLSPEFTFGTATASFQIEGAKDSRLPCIWDTFCATPGKIADNSNGEYACEHIKHWQQDVELIKSLGVDAYRFSVSWPRVIKENGELNQTGVDFYVQLLDALNEAGIKPYVTLYHWDLPQHLEDKGGWLNRDTAYQFADYADKISQAFGDRVYSYATLNEPFCSAYLGYEIGVHAPGLTGRDKGRKAAHHLLLAHGLAMQVLDKNSPDTVNGIVLNFTPCYSLTDSDADKRATDIADEYLNQWYIKPIMDGCYPDVINLLPTEQQPDIVDGDMDIISQKIDFLGINYYTRAIYQAHAGNWFEQIMPENVELTDMGWEVCPSAFTDLLVSLHQKYSLPPMMITENGAATVDKIENDQVYDEQRLRYLNSHINAVNDAIEAGVNITGYFVWSLMDNFEWAEGYVKRFGIVYVDYQTQKRTPKASAYAYRDLISNRG